MCCVSEEEEEDCLPCTDAQLSDVQVSLCGLNALLGRRETLHPVKMIMEGTGGSILVDLHKVKTFGCCFYHLAISTAIPFDQILTKYALAVTLSLTRIEIVLILRGDSGSIEALSWYSYVCVKIELFEVAVRIFTSLKCGRVAS